MPVSLFQLCSIPHPQSAPLPNLVTIIQKVPRFFYLKRCRPPNHKQRSPERKSPAKNPSTSPASDTENNAPHRDQHRPSPACIFVPAPRPRARSPIQPPVTTTFLPLPHTRASQFHRHDAQYCASQVVRLRDSRVRQAALAMTRWDTRAGYPGEYVTHTMSFASSTNTPQSTRS